MCKSPWFFYCFRIFLFQRLTHHRKSPKNSILKPLFLTHFETKFNYSFWKQHRQTTCNWFYNIKNLRSAKLNNAFYSLVSAWFEKQKKTHNRNNILHSAIYFNFSYLTHSMQKSVGFGRFLTLFIPIPDNFNLPFLLHFSMKVSYFFANGTDKTLNSKSV